MHQRWVSLCVHTIHRHGWIWCMHVCVCVRWLSQQIESMSNYGRAKSVGNSQLLFFFLFFVQSYNPCLLIRLLLTFNFDALSVGMWYIIWFIKLSEWKCNNNHFCLLFSVVVFFSRFVCFVDFGMFQFDFTIYTCINGFYRTKCTPRQQNVELYQIVEIKKQKLSTRQRKKKNNNIKHKTQMSLVIEVWMRSRAHTLVYQNM